jgi:hypothetical protein
MILFLIVGLLWGATTSFMKAPVDQTKPKSSFSLKSLLLRKQFLAAFALNQIGSLAFYYALSK